MNSRARWFLIVVALAPASAAAQGSQKPTRICLAPTSARANTGNTKEMIAAVRETFTSFLTGPTLTVTPLSARLESQVREEAKQAGCPYLLLTTVEHKRKKGSNLLGRATSTAIQHGAWRATGQTGSELGNVAASAAAGAAGAAASDWAYTVKTKDELSLSYRLEGPAGVVLPEKKTKRKAESDGEDLLTPMVEQASGAIAEVLAKRPQRER